MTNYLLTDNQFGFRRNRSNTQAIDRPIDRLSCTGVKYGLFVNFTKAFDTVDRKLLLQKLEQEFNVKGEILSDIQQILKPNNIKMSIGATETIVQQNRGDPRRQFVTIPIPPLHQQPFQLHSLSSQGCLRQPFCGRRRLGM